MRSRILITLAALLALGFAHTSYEGHKLYRVEQSTKQHAEFLRFLEQSSSRLDFWHLPKQLGHHAEVFVAPAEQLAFTETLRQQGISFSAIADSNSLRVSKPSVWRKAHRASVTEDSILTHYHHFEEINEYLDTLASKYSSLVSVKEIGKSFEGRPLKTITIKGKAESSKVVFLDAGIHAREWIAPATALYAISQLVEHANDHESVLANLTWVILPTVNPDGYEFSHEDDRMWRKTRKPAGKCKGTDANRNFDFHWGEVGASSSACADTYRGDTPFSEPETQAVRDALLALKGSCKFYLTLHSYGNYLLYPWGWTSALPDSWKDMDEVAQAGAAAIKQATGGKYTVGSSTNVLYAAAGGSDDWAFAEAEVPVAITMELPGGNWGFAPPESAIKDSVRESWIGIKAMAEVIARKY